MSFSADLSDPRSPAHRLALLGILLAGTLLRLYAWSAGESFHIFAINDEVSAFRVAMQFLAGEERAFYIGQPNFSEGHAPGPGWTLFWVGMYELGGGVIDRALIYVALLNSVVTGLVYLLARRLLRAEFALLCAFLFAVSPWPVYYATGLYNPIPLAFFGSLLFLALWQVLQREHSRAIFWVCLLSAILPHFHMIGVFYYPAILLLLWFSPVRLNRAWFVAGIVAGLLVYAPYFIGELRHGWENTRLILSGDGEFSFGVLKAISGPVTVLSNHPGRWLGDGMQGLYEFGDRWFGSRYVLLGVNLVSLLLSLTLFLWFAAWFLSRLRYEGGSLRRLLQQQPVIAFVGVLLFLPLSLFVLTGHNYSTRYAILIFPLLFLLPGLYLQQARPGRLKRLYRKSLPFLSLFGIWLLIAFFTHLSQQAQGEDYFINSFRKMELIRLALEKHAGRDVTVRVLFDDYARQAPERLRIATLAVSDYVGVYEHYIEPRKKSGVKNYVIRYRQDSQTMPEAIAWKGNGIVVYATD